MEKKRLGLALCGSYCTYEKLFENASALTADYALYPIMSDTATIAEAEPLGPTVGLDALLIAPCTGNTLSKLAHGITDSAVTMAAKAHLRNGRPLVIAFSTNDALSGSAESIARLLNRKNVYFVPFGQDDPLRKPCSLQADFSLLGETVAAALEGRQLQPLLR